MREALGIRCEYCGVEAGSPCRTRGDLIYQDVHRDRRQAWIGRRREPPVVRYEVEPDQNAQVSTKALNMARWFIRNAGGPIAARAAFEKAIRAHGEKR